MQRLAVEMKRTTRDDDDDGTMMSLCVLLMLASVRTNTLDE